MSLKITIEVDGHSEQQIAPALEVLTRTVAQGQGKPAPAPAGIAYENVAYLHQTIQQLQAQNQRLLGQMQAGQMQGIQMQTGQAGQTQVSQLQRHHQPADRIPPSKVSVLPPSVPQQYRLSQWQNRLHWLKRSALAPGRWLWSYCWPSLWSYKGWLLVFVAMSSAVYGTVMVAPTIADFIWPTAEFTEGENNKPGATQPAPQSAPNDAPTETAPAETTPDTPDHPSSKAGSHPPPPPAFRNHESLNP